MRNSPCAGRGRGVRIALTAVLICLLAVPAAGCAGRRESPSDRTIVVLADAGLRARLEPAAQAFSREEGGTVSLRFGSTAELGEAVRQGASADLLIFSGEPVMKALYKDKRIDNYRLFAFRNAPAEVYSMAKPMASRRYRYSQLFADLVTEDTVSVSGSNPNL